MINYFELGADKQLNEIVFAGSHDAGITGGGANVQTQNLNILEQAQTGVRLFDLRIAAATVGGKFGNDKVAELKAFHADSKLMKNETKTRHLEDVGRAEEITRTKLKGGAFGMGLSSMLEDAKKFVTSREGGDEFLLLKFDKCLNWGPIAETCINTLGSSIYKGRGNLNTTTLKDLRGKVVVLFSGSGMSELGGKLGPADGIMPFKNLYDKETGGTAYSPSFVGLQYYGKGGTSVANPSKKMEQNIKKQGKLMEGAKFLGSWEIVGMMYWTTTGMFESIKKRNDKMWDTPNVSKLKQLWAGGLEEYMMTTNPLLLPQGSPAVGPQRKRYMPNAIMIDFADEIKCQHIRALNDLTPDELANMG